MAATSDLEPHDGRGQPTVVYLDQFAWVDLARARLGRARRHEHLGARQDLAEAVFQGAVICPLSLVHYLETWKQRDERRRGELAAEMSLLSRRFTLAPARSLWPLEIDWALHALFGRPAEPEPIRSLGLGIGHAFGLLPEIVPNTDGLTGEQVFLAEWSMLAGVGANNFVDEERQRHLDATRFAEVQTEQSRKLLGWRADPRERMQRFRISALSHFESAFTAALIAAEISPAELEAVGSDGLEALVAAVPTIWVLTELRRVRYADAAQGFRPTDLNDLRALAVAVAYTDIVVTDKAWADMLRRTDLPERFGTVVCSNIIDAADALLQGRSA